MSCHFHNLFWIQRFLKTLNSLIFCPRFVSKTRFINRFLAHEKATNRIFPRLLFWNFKHMSIPWNFDKKYRLSFKMLWETIKWKNCCNWFVKLQRTEKKFRWIKCDCSFFPWPCKIWLSFGWKFKFPKSARTLV